MDIKERLHIPLRTQSRRASFVEAIANTTIGYAIAFFATVILFKIYNVPASHGQIFSITTWMTGLSVLRGYVLRRLWNSEWWKHIKWIMWNRKKTYRYDTMPPQHINCRSVIQADDCN